MKYLRYILLSLLLVTNIAYADYMSDLVITGTSGIWTDSRSFTDLSTAISTIGADEVDLYIAEEESVTTLTIPDNVTLHFVKDGSIANSGQLIVNTKNINAPLRQIFTGTGDIDFVDGSYVKSSWFVDVEEAIDVTNDDYLTLEISEQSYLDGDAAVGDNVTLEFKSTVNKIIVNSGITLSNVKSIKAGQYQIFAGAGDIDFLDGTELQLAWFRRLRSVTTWVESEKVKVFVNGSNIVDYTQSSPSNIVYDLTNGDFAVSNGITLTIYSQSNILNAKNKDINTGNGTLSYSYLDLPTPIEFDSIANVILSPILKVGDYVRTAAYYSTQTGGGALYEIVAAATGTADGGRYIDLSGSGLQAKLLWEGPLNAAHYGLISDFSTDNYARLQAWADALAAYPWGRLPKGYFCTSASIDFPEINDLVIEGAGKSNTIIIPLAAFPATDAILDFSSSVRTSTKQRLHLSDFGLYSENDPAFGYGKYGINIASRTYSLLNNLRITRASSDYAIYADYAWNNTFRDLNISCQTGKAGTGGVCIGLIDECNACVLDSNDLGGSGDGTNAIYVNGAFLDTKISGGSMQSFSESAIKFDTATNSRAIKIQNIYFEGGTPYQVDIAGSINDNIDILNNYLHSSTSADVIVQAGARTKSLHIHDNKSLSGAAVFERGTGAYLYDFVYENNQVDMDGPLFIIGDENPERLSMTINEVQQTTINSVLTGPETAPNNSTDLMNKSILSWTSSGVPVIALAGSGAFMNEHISTVSGASGTVSNTVVPIIAAARNEWMQGGWVSLILPVSGYSGTATIRIYDGVDNHDVTVSPTLGNYKNVILQAKLNAAASECTVSILPNGTTLQYGNPILYSGLRARDFNFNRDLKAVYAYTWDPASIAAGSTLTSSAIDVIGAEFGDSVTVSPPYDTQGLSVAGYVSGADEVKITLNNNTVGAVDLGSGDWTIYLNKK